MNKLSSAAIEVAMILSGLGICWHEKASEHLIFGAAGLVLVITGSAARIVAEFD